MEEFIEKNVDKIVNKVDDLFRDKIGPFIEKTIQDQKSKLVEDFLSQIKMSYVRELNEKGDMEIDRDTNIKTQDELIVFAIQNGDRCVCYIDSKYYKYDKMQELSTRFNKWLEGNNGERHLPYYTPPTFDDIQKFLNEFKTGEYLVYIYYTRAIGKIYRIFMITNFGSYFSIYENYKFKTKNYDYEIPYIVLKSIIETSYTGNMPFVIEDIHKYNPDNFNISVFSKSVESFRSWWIEYPLIGYKAELLKKENEKIREEVEKTKQEHESIKHMYETLELKDQYYKAVELLKQNKVEREAIEQARKDLENEKEKQEKELAIKIEKQGEKIREEYEKLNQKAKKLREIEDIDREFSKLALMKQKLEKKKKEFQKEKEEFDNLKNSLMEDSDS